ncbi:MAG: ABC transporter permease [Anaerobacillus sp.]
MTAFQLLRQRLDDDRRYKMRDLRSALDWTVWLYILIPALVIGIAYYRSWWITEPAWLGAVPEQTVIFPLILIATVWSLRIFTEDADQVYLLQNETLMNGLKKWGILFSLLNGMLVTLLGIGLALPLLIAWGWSTERIIITGVFVLLMSWNVKTSRYFIDLFVPSVWIKWLPVGLMNLVSIAVLIVMNQWGWKAEWVVILGGSCLLVLLYAQLARRMNIKGTFFHDVVIERGHKQRYTRLLMGQVGVAPKPMFVRKRPFLFQQSKRIRKKGNPETRILDLYLKWLLRSAGTVQYSLQVMGWAAVAIFLLPLVMKIIVLLFSLYALIGLSKADWREFSEGSYAQLFLWDQQLRENAARQALKVVTTPCFLLVCVVTGFAFPGWIGIFLFPLGGWFVLHESLRIVQRAVAASASSLSKGV